MTKIVKILLMYLIPLGLFIILACIIGCGEPVRYHYVGSINGMSVYKYNTADLYFTERNNGMSVKDWRDFATKLEALEKENNEH